MFGYYPKMFADEGIGGEQLDGSSLRRFRSSWEIQEMASVGVLISVAILIISGLASGIAAATTFHVTFNIDSGSDQSWAAFLLYATRWAGVVVTFFLVAVLGLVWWQVDGWADRLAELENSDDEADDSDEGDVVAAVVHITRNRTIATWTGVVLVVSVVAAAGSLVGVVLQNSPETDGIAASQYFYTGGEVLASLVLATIGGFACVSLRRRCNLILNVSDEISEVA